MSEKKLKNVGHSVRQRLLNLSRERNADFNVMLLNYTLERFLYRLSRSEHRNRFILKGAMLSRVWSGDPYRTTRDLDLLAMAEPAEMRLIFQDICGIEVEDDGVEFHVEGIRIEDIREEQEYGGVRVRIPAVIAGARVPLQIDVGFGDSVVPSAKETTYPTILDSPAPIIRAYPKETVIAEKLHAMVSLGIADSRMKDFYDIYCLALGYDFDGPSLRSAIASTFERRSMAIPTATPVALSSEFGEDSLKTVQWRAFIGGRGIHHTSLTLREVMDLINPFLLPIVVAMSHDQPFDMVWTPPGPWRQQ